MLADWIGALGGEGPACGFFVQGGFMLIAAALNSGFCLWATHHVFISQLGCLLLLVLRCGWVTVGKQQGRKSPSDGVISDVAISKVFEGCEENICSLRARFFRLCVVPILCVHKATSVQ